ncbi:MAG TPA: PfkB family carbohydrate kinase [Solirubrobacteraceae bacterium]|jgi:ribokinase
MPRVGVVGHVEWVRFAVVDAVPPAGAIAHARETFCEPAGGGAVAAVQLRKLAGAVTFLTALGDDAAARQVVVDLRERHRVGDLHVAQRRGPQRRTFTFLDDRGERTITVLGERIVPRLSDPLPWDSLGALDAIYLTGGDAGAVRAARAASILVATPRAMQALIAARVALDVLVRSASDAGEVYEPGMLDPAPRLVVSTRGAEGGVWEAADGRSGSWHATPLPGPAVDAYGCGDSFAAGLTYGLGAGMQLTDAIELAARCGAACLCGRGPYEGQLELA